MRAFGETKAKEGKGVYAREDGNGEMHETMHGSKKRQITMEEDREDGVNMTWREIKGGGDTSGATGR